MLNTQPWAFVASGEGIDIRADRGRGLPVIDPSGRELTLSCGTAIEFARLAARGLGWSCEVRALPNPDDADLLATLEIGEREESTENERALVDAIARRYTDRGDYTAATVDPGLVEELERGVADRGAWLRVVDREGDRLAVIQSLSSAEAAEAADPAYREELTSWLRHERSGDGIPLASLLGDTSANVHDVPGRDFTGQNAHQRPGGDDAPPPVERDTLLLIGSADDTPPGWLDAGQAVGWLLLRLTVAGFSSQPLGQALDVESARQRLGQRLGLVGHVQFLLRTGVGHGQPATGRRRLVAHI